MDVRSNTGVTPARALKRIVCALSLALFTGAASFVPEPPESPVADAAERGDVERVRALLRDGADVNAAQGDGMTALHWAGYNGNAEVARVLLFAGAHVDPATRLGAYTPLHLASRNGAPDVVRALVEAGSDVARATSTGVRAIHFAAESGDTATLRLLLTHGADPDARDVRSGRTPLMFAAADGRLDALTLLVEAGAHLSPTTEVVDYVALTKGDEVERRRRARLLAIERGEDPDSAARAPLGVYGQGRPPEPDSAKKPDPTKKPDSTKKADSTEEDAEGRAEPTAGTSGEARATVPASGTGAAGDRPARATAPHPDPDVDEEVELTIAPGSRPSAAPLSYSDLVGRQGGFAAIHFAARDGRVDEALALLEAGADVNQRTEGDRSTPLLVAAINGNYDLAVELLTRGADPNLYSEDGAGPLFAALNGRWAHRTWYPQPTAWKQQRTTHLEVMEALLEAGADPNARLETHLWYVAYNAGRIGVDYAGATPFWRAAYSLDVDAMRLLVAYGADPNVPTVKPAQRRRPGARREDGDKEEDPSGLPPVPVGGAAVYPIHAASGVGYGTSRVGQQHVHAPDGWLRAVTYLVEELGADVNARDHEGYTALHNAAARGDDALIRYLVEKGADVTVVSRRGQTTADMANGPQQRVQPFPETIALLEKLGSKNSHNCQSC